MLQSVKIQPQHMLFNFLALYYPIDQSGICFRGLKFTINTFSPFLYQQCNHERDNNNIIVI